MLDICFSNVLMSQNIILTQVLNSLMNKRASLKLKSHWNNINMASGRVYGRWRRRRVCEHAILFESAFVQCQWSCIVRAREEKVSSHWEITRSVWLCYSPLANCLEGRYLCKSRSHHPNKKKFKVLDHTVYINPGEIFETFA